MIGFDLVEIKRFKNFKKTDSFVQKTFSRNEITYCFGFKDAATHLAGTFAGKEAAVKALGANGVSVYDIEVRRNKNSQPEVWMNNKKILDISISITHTDKIAGSIVLAN